jgi:hypothetical protein
VTSGEKTETRKQKAETREKLETRKHRLNVETKRDSSLRRPTLSQERKGEEKNRPASLGMTGVEVDDYVPAEAATHTTRASGDQNGHLGTCEQEVFCLFESGDGRFTRDGRKSLEKVFESLSALQIVEEGLEGHARSAKHRSSAKNIRTLDDDSHERIVSRAMSGGFLEFELGDGGEGEKGN